MNQPTSDLAGLERAVRSRAPDRVDRMIAALAALANGSIVEDAADPAPGDPARLVPRLAALVAGIMVDSAVEFDQPQLERLLLLGSTIGNLFAVLRPDEGTDILFAAMGSQSEDFARRLPLLSLDSRLEWPLDLIFEQPPRIAQLLFATLIARAPLMTVHGQNRRDRLLELASRLTPADIPRSTEYLSLIGAAWMTCSYAGSPEKHRIKRTLNAALRSLAQSLGFTDRISAERPIKARPTMLVAAEYIHEAHVQYRYFGQYLRQLRQRFELVLLTEENEVGAAVSSLFDRVLTFRRDDASYLGQVYRMIVETAPDIIFWPSVGMRLWGPLFANLRLAPIQFTALGHSASTFCDTIDYYLLEDGYVSDSALFGETVITVPDDSLIFERAPQCSPQPPDIRAAPSPLRIALPSNILKLNPRFLAIVARIVAQADRPVEIHVLPNAVRHELLALRGMVARVLSGATVHGQLPYPRYLEILAGCDLVLSPLPFGGLHSTVDALRAGLPVVAMETPEPHGRTDAMLLRRLAMPGWLVAANEEDYVAAALRIIGDDALRVAIGRQALALDIDRLLFGDATTPLRSDVGDAVWWLYRHHERIRADGRRLWNQRDRDSFVPELTDATVRIRLTPAKKAGGDI